MNTLTITSVVIDGTDFTVEGTITEDAGNMGIAARPTSMTVPADGNPDWLRTFRISEQGVSCKRFAVGAVILPLGEFAKIASAVDNELTFPPRIDTQPEDKTYASGALGCTISCKWASEIEPSVNLWEYAAWNGTGYDAWETAAAGTDVTADGITTSTLTFTAGATGYLDKTKFRKTITNTQGTVTSQEAILTVTT